MLPGCEKILPTSKEIKNVPHCLSDAGGFIDCGNINSRHTQALELHCGDLLNCHRYYRVDVSLTADEKGCFSFRFTDLCPTNFSRRELTHDTKRGEDAPARINVWSEMPDEWLKKTTDLDQDKPGQKKALARPSRSG